jgi:anti-anti-sigma regulatory factor
MASSKSQIQAMQHRHDLLVQLLGSLDTENPQRVRARVATAQETIKRHSFPEVNSRAVDDEVTALAQLFAMHAQQQKGQAVRALTDR